MKPTTIVFDIETVPSKTAYAHPDEVLRMAQKRGQKIDEFASLCPVLCSVIAVGILELETGTQHAHVCGGVDREFDVLTVVNAAINSAARLVTFNGRRFDLPALIHRSRINGVQPAGILLRSVLQKPWEHLPHVDMANVLSFGGAMSGYSLEAYAIAYGLDNPKTGGDGGGVLELVRTGQIEKLAQYVMGDVRATAELYRRVMVQ